MRRRKSRPTTPRAKRFRSVATVLMMHLHHRIILSMRTTVTIDDDVYEAALANARATGRRVGRVLSEMARSSLQLQERPRSRKKEERFAAFDVPKGSRVIHASRVQKALDDDGIV